jgi:hypothetical protein
MNFYFQKEQLAYQYNWSDECGSLFKGIPSRRLFDLKNGFQVLFIINCFYQSIGLTSASTGQKIERLIQSQLPSDMKSELSVFNWLKGVYLYHSH